MGEEVEIRKTTLYKPIHEYEVWQSIGREFDVCKAWSMIAEQGEREVYRTSVKNFYDTFLSDTDNESGDSFSLFQYYVDKEKAMHHDIDTTIPVLVAKALLNINDPAEDWNVFTQFIDGVHRMYKAYHIGLETMPVFLLTVEETAQIMYAPFQRKRAIVKPTAFELVCPHCNKKNKFTRDDLLDLGWLHTKVHDDVWVYETQHDCTFCYNTLELRMEEGMFEEDAA